MRRVLVTGATGFVGGELCRSLTQSGYIVRGSVRDAAAAVSAATERIVVGDIASADWRDALRGVQQVIHTAARVHAPGTSDELYLQSNVAATERLVEAAARAGVERFVYLSSVKVNGEGGARAYGEHDLPHPCDAYGRSKWLGERCVLEADRAGKLPGVVVRSPLVFGPGVRANFRRLLAWVDRGWPLPFAAIDNRRSLISVWNLCDFLAATLTHPGAPGRTWLVSDGQDLATPALIRRIAAAMQRPARLVAVPVPLLRGAGRLFGRGAEIARLCDSLTVEMTPARTELAWTPPVPLEEGLARTVNWYLREGRSVAA